MLDSIPNSCTITIDTVGADTLRYTLVYNGFSLLHNFSRTGTVIIKKLIGTHWYDAGTTVWFTYVNLQIEKISTGKTFTFNGEGHSKMYPEALSSILEPLRHPLNIRLPVRCR